MVTVAGKGEHPKVHKHVFIGSPVVMELKLSKVNPSYIVAVRIYASIFLWKP